MNKYLNLKVLSLCSFLATLFVACSQPPQQTKMPPMPVTVMSAKAVDIPLSFSYPANLTSDKDVIIKAKVSGQIVQQFFKAGDKVQKDQILFMNSTAKIFKRRTSIFNLSFLYVIE